MTNASKPTTIMLPVTISTGADVASMESEITTHRARVAELEAEVERVRAFWEAECKRIADERDALNVEIVTQERSMAVERGLLSRCERPDVVAALRLQLEQSKAEVERLTKERDAATASLDNWIRVARNTTGQQWKERAEKAELDLRRAVDTIGSYYCKEYAAHVLSVSAAEFIAEREGKCEHCIERDRDAALARATAAEAREAGMKAALNMMDECCWQAWKAFTEEGPNAAEKFLHDVCITEGIMNNDGGRIPRAALAATAKEVKPCR